MSDEHGLILLESELEEIEDKSARVKQLERERDEARKELERERMRLAAWSEFQQTSITTSILDIDTACIFYPHAAQDAEKERDEAMVEIDRWKLNFISFAVPYCLQYGKERFGDDYLHPLHYDILKEAGAVMDNFKRAEEMK